jgi:hypothetical protein
MFESKAQADEKASPPHILADEHFNPPAAEQRSYRTLDGVLKPLLINLENMVFWRQSMAERVSCVKIIFIAGERLGLKSE